MIFHTEQETLDKYVEKDSELKKKASGGVHMQKWGKVTDKEQ